MNIAQGTAPAPSVAPGDRGTLALALPADWRESDALYLTACDPQGRDIDTWTWMTKGPDEIRRRVVALGGTRERTGDGGQVVLEAAGTRVAIDRATGRLASVERDGRHVSLANGPRIVEGKAKLTSLTHRADGDGYVVEAAYEGNLKQVRWRLDGSGWLELSYRYENPGRHAHLGVTFDYPEAQVTGLRWLGRGPYRVWKNRIQGTTFDVWQKAYNDTRTGADWVYPEFKGHHADLYWAVLADEGAADHGRHRHRGPLPARPHPALRRRPHVHRGRVPRGRHLLPARDRADRHEVRRPGDARPRGPAERAVGDNPTQHMGAYEARLFFRFGESGRRGWSRPFDRSVGADRQAAAFLRAPRAPVAKLGRLAASRDRPQRAVQAHRTGQAACVTARRVNEIGGSRRNLPGSRRHKRTGRPPPRSR